MFPSHNWSKLKSELSMRCFRTGLSRKTVWVRAAEITEAMDVLFSGLSNCASFRAATLPGPSPMAVRIVRCKASFGCMSSMRASGRDACGA